MGLNNIEKKSIGYNLLKFWMKFWHDNVYYRKYTVSATDNIPINKPLIFTPNHQNALMDALALLFSVNIQMVFLARADIFKKPAIAKILYFLKILPVYRVRDGYDSAEKTKEIFRKTVDIITAGNAMVILPEGNHSRIRRLRPLKKGFARMAFQTEENNKFELDLQIVPVGIDYDNHFDYRSSLAITFGDPIPVSDYIPAFKENEPIALNSLKDRLSEHMAPTLINIKSIDNYELYDNLRVIYRHRMAMKLNIIKNIDQNRVKIDQQTILHIEKYEAKFPVETSELKDEVIEYTKLKQKLNLSDRLICKKRICSFSLIISSLCLLVTFPFFIIGAINNFLPYWLPIWASEKPKDEQFRSSIKFAVSSLTFPIFYLLQTIITLIIFKDWIASFTYFISLPLLAIISWKWAQEYTRIVRGWKYKLLSIRKSKDFSKITNLYANIIAKTDKITSET